MPFAFPPTIHDFVATMPKLSLFATQDYAQVEVRAGSVRYPDGNPQVHFGPMQAGQVFSIEADVLYFRCELRRLVPNSGFRNWTAVFDGLREF